MIPTLITIYLFSCVMAGEAYLLLPGLALVTDVPLSKDKLKGYKVLLWVLAPGFNLVVAIGTFWAILHASGQWWRSLDARAGK